MPEYRKVTLDYLDTAPHRVQLKQELPVTPEMLFAFFERSDSYGWAGVETMEWSEPPFDAATTRTAVQAAGRVDEQFLLWEQDQRMVFRLDRGHVGILGALVEDWQFAPAGNEGCLLTWIVAYEFQGWMKMLGPIMAVIVRKQVRKTFANLPAALRAGS